MNTSNAKQIWVVKAGSSLLTKQGAGLNHQFINLWVKQILELRKRNIDCILVSSGAVAEGLNRMKIQSRPHELHMLQAAAAIGQMGLIQYYESQFQKHQLHTAQILLTHEDFSHRQRYLNARSTLKTLLELKVVPIVNENDSIAIDEIRFGDNDTLAALVANLVDANRLIILTDQNGLFSDDPRQNPNATLVTKDYAGNPDLIKLATKGKPGKLGRGGMLTKVKAAERAALSGTTTIIASGNQANILTSIADNNPDTGTWLLTDKEPLSARKQWLANQLQIKGKIIIDQGAKKVLTNKGSSLLAVGISTCSGKFSRGEAVLCVDENGHEIAQGLINYNNEETKLIAGKPSTEFEAILGYIDEPELIHRDNLVILSSES